MTTNGLSANNDFRLVISCVLFWLFTFGFLTVAVEVTNRSTASVLLLAPIVTFVVIKKLSISPPSDDAVEEVLGKWIDVKEDSLVADEGTDVTSGGGRPFFGVWAHRFAGLDAPENTMEALETCIKNGAKAVEFDLVLTSDMVPVVFHDPNLDRITNYAGDIRQLPWSKVKTFDVAVNHPFRSKFADAHIPLFEDIIKKCVEHKIHMIIDMKDERPEAINAVVDTFAKYPDLYKLALVSGFNPFCVWSIRKANPKIVAGLTWRPYYMSHSKYSPDESQCVPYPYSAPVYFAMRLLDICHYYAFNNICQSLIGFSVVLLDKNHITREVVNRWKRRHVRTMAWTVNIPIEKLMFMKHYGVPVITDSMLGPSDPTK